MELTRRPKDASDGISREQASGKQSIDVSFRTLSEACIINYSTVFGSSLLMSLGIPRRHPTLISVILSVRWAIALPDHNWKLFKHFYIGSGQKEDAKANPQSLL